MIKITDVKIESGYNWGNIEQQKNWNIVRLCNLEWNSIKMTAITGTQIFVEVTVIENTWELVKDTHINWQEIVMLSSWSTLKTF